MLHFFRIYKIMLTKTSLIVLLYTKNFGTMATPPSRTNPPIPTSATSATSPTLRINYCGLLNLGETCYSNACVQALYTFEKICRLILANASAGPFHKALSNLLRKMITTKWLEKDGWSYPSVIAPKRFNFYFRLVRPEFELGQQHDAQEFLTFVLELLHFETNAARGR